MSWICKQCGLNNVNIVLHCYCGNERSEFEPFDSVDEIISNQRLKKIDDAINFVFRSESERSSMTPQEELFSKLFNHEMMLVKDMDILTLRAHRESLAEIAFEARARMTAVDKTEESRKHELRDKNKPTGFARSINTDDVTTNAINAVKDRQKRMSKSEKLVEGLIKLGYSREDAEKKLSAGTILARIQGMAASQNASQNAKPSEEKKPIFNPFEKK